MISKETGTVGMLRQTLLGLLYGLAAALIWGGFPVMTRFGATRSELDMYDITFIRFAVAALLTFPVLFRSPLPNWKLTSLLTIGIGAPYVLVVSDGLSLAPVALFAVLTPTTMVMFSACLGSVLLKERLAQRQWVGIATILVGSTVAAIVSLDGPTGNLPAIALFVFGGLLWAVYTVCTKGSGVDALAATTAVSLLSLLVYGPPYLYFRGLTILHGHWPGVLQQGVYQGALVSVVALFFYSRAVSLLGASVGSCFAALVPTIAMAEAAFLLGETPPLILAFGLGLSTIGIIAVLVKPAVGHTSNSVPVPSRRRTL